MKRLLFIFLGVALVTGLFGCDKFFPKKSDDKTSASVKTEQASPVSAKLAIHIAGVYSASGTNPGGQGRYHGTVTIRPEGDLFKVHWEVGTVYDGVGKLDGKIFKVDWGNDAEPVGVVTYTVGEGGVLQGTWYTFKNPGVLGTETLTRK